MTEDYPNLCRALSFAARAHQGQLRKDGKTPYIAHPARVAAVLSAVFGIRDSETLTAAALHDTIEDTKTDRDELIEQFGPRVAEYVALLTKDKRKPEEERERDYLDVLAAAPIEVKLCKLADAYDNLIDSTGLSAEERAKRVRKTRDVLARFEPGFPAEWSHAIQCVRDQLAAVERAE
jgi:guanosine-3',5'-bis(diphosphate) 3'-pyrophosphohydrolase